MNEGFPQNEREMTPEEQFAPYTIDVRSFDELPKERQDEIDTLLAEDLADVLGKKPQEAVADTAEQESARFEEAPLAEEAFVSSEAEELREEAREILANTPPERRGAVEKKMRTVIHALIAGGVGLFGAVNEAHAEKFDLRGAILGGVVEGIDTVQEIKRLQRQAEFNANSQLRQAQLSYDQTVRYIQGQIVALENPRLKELSDRQADAYWNAQYSQRMAWAKTPEQQEQVKAQMDGERARATAAREMQNEQQRLNLEIQLAQADVNFENQKAQIAAYYQAELVRIEEQVKFSRRQRRY